MKPKAPISAWLIEKGDSEVSSPLYATGGITRWTTKHDKAIKFETKSDAESYAANHLPGIDVRICEHEWS